MRECRHLLSTLSKNLQLSLFKLTYYASFVLSLKVQELCIQQFLLSHNLIQVYKPLGLLLDKHKYCNRKSRICSCAAFVVHGNHKSQSHWYGNDIVFHNFCFNFNPYTFITSTSYIFEFVQFYFKTGYRFWDLHPAHAVWSPLSNSGCLCPHQVYVQKKGVAEDFRPS